MDQSEYMKGDIKDIINRNVKPRTKVPCDSPCCDSLNNEDGGERAERAGEGPCSVAPPHWLPQCTPRHCSSRNSTPLSYLHGSQRSRPTQRPYPRQQLTGPRLSTQPNQGQQVVSLRIWTWHQARRVALSLRAMFTEEDGLQRERKDRCQQQSPETRAQECSQSSCFPGFGLWDTLCGLFLSYFELGFCIFQPKESWLKQQQRDSIQH